VKSRVARNISIIACLIGCAGVSNAPAARADVLPTFEPEIVSNVWEENAELRASVTLNGKEITTFKGDLAGLSADQRAETFATHLKQLVTDDKFDVSKLVPSHDGDVASAKIDGTTILKFEGIETEPGKSVLDQSCKTVNMIRTALGAQLLPANFLKLADMAGKDSSNIASIANIGGKSKGASFSGHASWYGGKFHGRKTSDGSRYNQDGLTAAHRSLPFGTKLLVMNRRTGQSCVVQVNDRGPFVGDRIIDLSRSGVATVDCLVLGM
jgi:rare lipoprotein A